MKQYLSQEQTTKLIDLGFEKPKNTQYIQRAKIRNLRSPFIEFGEPEFEGSYSIGELIELLPKEYWDKAASNQLTITFDSYLMGWVVKYTNYKFYQFGTELIDVIYNMILTLKEEVVI